MAKQRTPRREMRKIDIELKHIRSADVEDRAPALEDTYFGVEMSIGERDKNGADSFQCLIATPEGLRKAKEAFVIENRSLMVVDRYEWPKILQELKSIIGGIKAINALDGCQKLQRYFEWECEDMEWNEPF